MVILAAGTGTVIAMGIGGLVGVLLISGVFYAIGRGEDRDRAAESDPPADDQRADAAVHHAQDPCPQEAEPQGTTGGRPRLPSRRRRRRRP